MAKRLLVLFLLLSLFFICGAKDKKVLLRDGFGLSGVDGRFSKDNETGKWMFASDEDISDEINTIKAKTKIEVLASSCLEKMIANIGEDSTTDYRLWGTVTKYKGKNFIFANYFLPVGEIDEKASDGNGEDANSPAEDKPKIIINGPNDLLLVPDAIAQKLAARKVIKTEELKKPLELKQDSILADRTGFIIKDKDGQWELVLDAIGQNVDEVSFKLLDGEILEMAQLREERSLEKVRFKIAGVVTKYKGEYYLLLQRARQVYGHGNF